MSPRQTQAEQAYRLAFETWESLISLSILADDAHIEALAEVMAKKLPELLQALIDARRAG